MKSRRENQSLKLPFILILIYFGSSGNLKAQKKSTDAEYVKVAAVQMSGYDKTLTPGLVIDVVGKATSYIEQAARDSAQMVVFPEYLLGRIQVPGKETKAIAEVASQNNIYVLIGCWEVFEDKSFSNAILLLNREGESPVKADGKLFVIDGDIFILNTIFS